MQRYAYMPPLPGIEPLICKLRNVLDCLTLAEMGVGAEER